MFEIGNSLREARLRQGLDLARVETETKIRGKYLQSLEEERFDLLPAETYVKGFLRSYAEYLGLDGQLYVDEFNSRFATAADEPVAPQRRVGRPPRRSESHFVVVALAGIVAVTVLVVVAWQFGAGDGTPQDVDLLGTPPGATTPPATGAVQTVPAAEGATTETPPAPPKKPPRRTAKLVLTAANGPCWVSVRAGSSTGELLYEGTLEQGQTQRFERKRIWIQLGAGENLAVKLNGKDVKNFPTGAAIAVVTPKGVTRVPTA